MDLASAFLFGHPVHSERKQQHIHRLKLLVCFWRAWFCLPFIPPSNHWSESFPLWIIFSQREKKFQCFLIMHFILVLWINTFGFKAFSFTLSKSVMIWVLISSYGIQQRESKTKFRAIHRCFGEQGVKSNKAARLQRSSDYITQHKEHSGSLSWKPADFMIPLTLRTEQETAWSLHIDYTTAKSSPAKAHPKLCQSLSRCSFHHVWCLEMTQLPVTAASL